jgi:hypothetical protein
MIDAELAAFGAALTSVFQNMDAVKYGPVPTVTVLKEPPSSPAPAPPSIAVGSLVVAPGKTPHAVTLRTAPIVINARMRGAKHT